MGDMKTPDFDDLLAAFDMPDEGVDGEVKAEDGITESRGSSPCSSTSQGEPPVISVIVKNRVQPESFGEAESSGRDDTVSLSGSGTDPEEPGKLGGALLASHLNSKTPEVPMETQVPNGFEGTVRRSQGETNGELWSCPSPLSSTSTAKEGGSTRHTADARNRLKPLSPRMSTGTAPLASVSSSSPPPLSDNQRLPTLHSTRNDGAARLPGPPPGPPRSNGTVRARIQHIIDSDSEDSEPDLGSPLVIQESPCSPSSSPPKFPAGSQVSSPPFNPRPLPCPPPLSSSRTTSNTKPQPPEEMPSTRRSPAPSSSALAGSATVPEEEYPEHVIDERDSPESPPPDQTGFVVPKRSPGLARAPTPASGRKKEPRDREEPMESEPSRESRPEEVNGMEGKKTDAVDGENADGGNPGVRSSSSSSKAQSADAAGVTSPPSRPLKVKIKTVKTPTGSITRTVTRVAPKGAGGALSKGADNSKPSPGGRKIMSRPKRTAAAAQQVKKETPKPAGLLPAVSAFQDASTAMLAAASKVQSKAAAADAKPRVSATAVSITKAAALPAVSSSPRIITPGGGVTTMRGLGQRTLTSGMGVSSSSPVPLVPPQGSSRPASIVNSTGAIISKSQSSLVEAFNKILNSKNLLPSYKPDLTSPLPTEWRLPLPAQGYRCLECGDAFALERSLARHYDRRSLRIEVTCNHCAKRLAFFNKCSLLLHAREHKERGLVMQCSHLVMRPVAVEQMIGQQEPTTTGVLSAPPLSSPTATSASALALTASSPAPQPQQPTHGKKAEAVQYTSNKCPECQVQFCSTAEVAAHFQDIKATQTTSCMQCAPPMLLPNGCSAAAHQRIHKACPPHVCPECGGTAKQPTFQQHLDDTCLHFARRIGYRCSSCQVVFGGLNSVKSHIEVAHCDMFHKCPTCPMAFKSAPSAQSHIGSQHPTLTGGQAKIIYKCVMCDTVFTQKSLLYIHFDTHLARQKVDVYKCPDCTKLYSQRASLMDHIKSLHKAPTVKQEPPPSPAPPPSQSRAPAKKTAKLESSDGEEWEDQDEEEDGDGEKAKTRSGWSCVPCHARYADREDYITHMAEQHSKVLKKFPCNRCESSFTSTSSMRRHTRDKHKGLKRGFPCQLCTEGERTFSSRVMLERHVQLRHGMNPLSQPDSPPLRHSKGAGGPDDADSSSEQDGGPAPRRRAAVKTERGEEEDGANGASPAKKPRSSAPPSSSSPLPATGFRCAPCGFATEDRAAFLEHIPQHRSEGAGGPGLQCSQCGACFTSAPSLSRHRFITHRVRDAAPPADNHHRHRRRPEGSPGNASDRDDDDAGSPSSSSSSHRPSGRRREEGEGRLACKVCGKRFEKSADLNTHFRTHGMAYISARNAGKST